MATRPLIQWALGEPIQHFNTFTDNAGATTPVVPGRALHVRIPTVTGTAGNVTITADDGTTDTIECPLGSSIWQVACTNATAAGAVGAIFTNWS